MQYRKQPGKSRKYYRTSQPEKTAGHCQAIHQPKRANPFQILIQDDLTSRAILPLPFICYNRKTLMKTTLIFLSSLAIILGIFAYFAVFGSGSYAVTGSRGSGAFAPASSSIITLASTSVPASVSSTQITFPAPLVSWPESSATISVTGLALQGNTLTFSLSVTNGSSPTCVPLDLRMVVDESGDLNPPNPSFFSFPDSGNCNASPGKTYQNQNVSFSIAEIPFPLLFTTETSSSTFFEVATTTDGQLTIVLPGTSG